jgi:hypothetical protein
VGLGRWIFYPNSNVAMNLKTMKKLFLALICVLPVLTAAQTQASLSDAVNDDIIQIDKRLKILERLNSKQIMNLEKMKIQVLNAGTQAQLALDSTASQTVKSLDLGISISELRGSINKVSLSNIDLAEAQKRSSWQLSNETSQLENLLKERSHIFSFFLLIATFLIFFNLLMNRKRNRKVIELENSFLSIQQATIKSNDSTQSSAVELSIKLLETLSKSTVLETTPLPDSNSIEQERPSAVNHTLSTKLADEIYRMRKRLLALPIDTPGLTPLQKSLERLETELENQGYEIVDYVGETYNDQMTVRPRFVPSDDLAPGERVITKVVSPQVNYQGVMLRMSDIEVSVGS